MYAPSEDSAPSVAKTSVSRELFCWNCGTKGLKEWMPKCQNCGEDAWTNPFATYRKDPEEEEAASESESVFEEALGDLRSWKTRGSVTCMGDLTKSAKGKKSASTLTVASDVASSWIGKLTEDIKSKILNLKPFKKKEVVEEKFASEAVQYSEAVEFKITASTPVGVFDVTVKQYKDGREVSEFSIGIEDTQTVTVAPITDPAGPKPDFVTDIKDEDFYWSNESLTHSEYEPIEAASNSGEDEMEEFAEAYGEDSKQNKKKPTVPTPEKSTLAKETLKTDKAPFFEIQKCHPRHFVQEIVPKTLKTPQDTTEQTKKNDGKVILLEKEKIAEGVEHKLVIENSSDDLVIYIQVEVEGAEGYSKENKFLIKEHSNEPKEEIMVGNRVMLTQDRRENSENNSDASNPEEMFRKKTVTFIDETSELIMEKKIREMLPEEEPFVRGHAVTVVTMDNLQRAQIILPQNQRQDILRTEPKEVVKPAAPSEEVYQANDRPDNNELEKALNLIRDIENDIMEVKVSDAISILPNLESELRKHLHYKMKTIADKDNPGTGSIDNFLSAAEVWTGENLPDDRKSDDSEERLRNLLTLLSDLEEAVQTDEIFKDRIELCDRGSSKIYGLLHALANSIREMEDDATIVGLSQTLDIASELDAAVREYDGILKEQPSDYVTPGKGNKRREKVSDSNWEKEEVPAKEHLKNVRKRVFEIVEEEAMETEIRIERDFDRIDRLEKENEEAMKFVEAFLEKTQRRTAELNTVKTQLQELSGVLNETYLELLKIQTARNSTAYQRQNTVKTSRDRTPPAKEVPIRDTVSGLLLALNDLKTRAREKKEVCRGILQRVSNDDSSENHPVKESSRSSRSSYTAKNADGLFSSVKDFKQIGESSLYLSWTKPEGTLADSIIGYEILVNGKLNQKVRNPQRLQSVLYSVNLSEEAEVQLFALVEDEPKVLLTTVTYPNT